MQCAGPGDTTHHVKALRIQIFVLQERPTKNAKLTNDSRSHEDVVKIVSGDQRLIQRYKKAETASALLRPNIRVILLR